MPKAAAKVKRVRSRSQGRRGVKEERMKTVWITYAWADNEHRDVDFVAQDLTAAGLAVKLDRWTIEAGKRLWEQISRFIESPDQSDAWLLYATQASLGSERCKEELAYALDRALRERGGGYPIIGLFPGAVDQDLIPGAIRTRLHVSLQDPDWKKRIKAAVEGQRLEIDSPTIPIFHLAVHRGFGRLYIELRPRAGSWNPFVVGVPVAEEAAVSPHVILGPSGRIPSGGMVYVLDGLPPQKDGWAFRYVGNDVTPTTSAYVACQVPPSKILFGTFGGGVPQIIVDKPLSYGTR